VDGPGRQTLPITVVIPAFNREGMIARAVRSVQAQRRFAPAEILCVDDASADDTAGAAAAAGARVLRHDVNQGAAGARNTAIAAATQPWLALLDSDDEWLPGHLETLWPRRDGHVLVSGSALALEADGTVRVHGRVLPWPARLTSPRPLLWLNLVSASGSLVRTDVVRDVGGFDTSLRLAEDLDLWLRVLARGTGIVVPTPVYVWHKHAAQKSGAALPSFAVHRDLLRAYEREPWYSERWLQRRIGVQEWDVFRARRAAGEGVPALRGLLPVLRRPDRLYGLVGGLASRLVARRRGPRAAAGLLPAAQAR
jgi:glycosyltransferase involved in cell wall biosynthesis